LVTFVMPALFSDPLLPPKSSFFCFLLTIYLCTISFWHRHQQSLCWFCRFVRPKPRFGGRRSSENLALYESVAFYSYFLKAPLLSPSSSDAKSSFRLLHPSLKIHPNFNEVLSVFYRCAQFRLLRHLSISSEQNNPSPPEKKWFREPSEILDEFHETMEGECCFSSESASRTEAWRKDSKTPPSHTLFTFALHCRFSLLSCISILALFFVSDVIHTTISWLGSVKQVMVQLVVFFFAVGAYVLLGKGLPTFCLANGCFLKLVFLVDSLF